MIVIRGSFPSSQFQDVQPGQMFLSLSGEFATGLCPESPLDGATLYLKRSDTIVVAFGPRGIQSHIIGSDYGDIEVILVPFPRLVRTTDEDLWRALRVLTQPYA